MRVGVVGAENEIHTRHIAELLRNKGIEVLIIDTIKYPHSATLSLLDNQTLYNGENIDDIKSFYIRAVFYSLPPYDLEEVRRGEPIEWDGWYVRYASERERQSHLTSWLRSLPMRGIKVVNPVETFDLHYLKPYQLFLLRKNKFPIPKTLVTNNPRILKEFKQAVGEVVYKPVAGGASCKLMCEEDWRKDRLQLLRNAPVIFQEYIKGEDIRVFVLEDKVISSAIIYTDEVDFRGKEKEIKKIELPSWVKNMCVKAAKICGMVFTGIDLKRKSDTDYFILECNPSPMFLGFQFYTQDPIDEYLANYLIKKACE